MDMASHEYTIQLIHNTLDTHNTQYTMLNGRRLLRCGLRVWPRAGEPADADTEAVGVGVPSADPTDPTVPIPLPITFPITLPMAFPLPLTFPLAWARVLRVLLVLPRVPPAATELLLRPW